MNEITKYKTICTPEGCYLTMSAGFGNTPHEVICKGWYDNGKREKSLDGYYFRTDLTKIK